MSISIDLAYRSRNHYGEELCGDKVEIVNNDDCRIIILADGMGSGVRANILSTMTSKMIATMMEHRLSVEELIDTIAKTLPVSSVNHVAYSTFSVIQAFFNGEVYVFEYDNPQCILIRDGKVKPLDFKYREISGKKIREAVFQAQLGDSLVITSDGCLYCGTGDIMNYKWDWKALANCAEESANRTRTAQQMADRINNVCYDLYGHMPSDDTTVAVARIVEERAVNILTGPPVDPADDCRMVNEFLEMDGVKIVSGGVTGKLVAREMHETLHNDVGKLDPEIPPTARIKGIDLVTEGVLTLNKAISLLERYADNDVSEDFYDELSRENGATRITCYLMEDCTTVNLFVGRAVNKDYTSKELPFEISVRQNLVKRLEAVLKKMEKTVNVYYY